MIRSRPLRFATALATPLLVLFPLACGDGPPVGPENDAPARPAAAAARHAPSTSETPGPRAFPNRYLVGLSGATPADLAGRIEALGGTLAREHPEIDLLVVDGLSDDAAERLRRVPGVAAVEPDLLLQWIPSSFATRPVRPGARPPPPPGSASDQRGTFFYQSGFQWNLIQIAADAAWLSTRQGEGVRVAVLDTGIDPGHVELAGRVDLASSGSVLTPGSSPCGAADEADFLDRNFHGTFVSALISANGAFMSSVAPDASLVAIKVLGCTGTGLLSDVVAGLLLAVAREVDVANLSLSATFPKSAAGAGRALGFLQQVADFARRNGVLIVAAAGNDAVHLDRDGNSIVVPAQLAGVVGVGATGPTNQSDFDALASYSSHGISGVALVAPGGENFFHTGNLLDGILSACSGLVCGGTAAYLFSFGTSFATAHTSGAAAVVGSELGSRAGPSRLARCLVAGAEDLGRRGTDPVYSRGRLHVLGATSAAGC